MMLWCLLLIGAPAPPVPPPDPPRPAIQFPKEVTPAPAPPKVDPAAVQKIVGDAIYVVSSDAPILVFASPAGIATVTEDSGPIKIKGRFAVDGTGKSETRTYSAKHVFAVEGLSSGRMELLVVPVGGSLADAIRKTIDVEAGEAPRPPPVPPTPDPPAPPAPPAPPKPEPVTSFRVIWVLESGDNAKAAVADAKSVRDYLTANTTSEGQWAGWREFDPQQEAANETPIIKALWAAVKPKITVTPCLVIEVNGKAVIEPYPATAADALVLLKKYKEGR